MLESRVVNLVAFYAFYSTKPTSLFIGTVGYFYVNNSKPNNIVPANSTINNISIFLPSVLSPLAFLDKWNSNKIKAKMNKADERENAINYK